MGKLSSRVEVPSPKSKKQLRDREREREREASRAREKEAKEKEASRSPRRGGESSRDDRSRSRERESRPRIFKGAPPRFPRGPPRPPIGVYAGSFGGPPVPMEDDGAWQVSVYVSGLPFDCDPEDVQNIFKDSKIAKMDICREGRDGPCKGYAFVQLCTAHDFRAAMRADGSRYNGRTIHVAPQRSPMEQQVAKAVKRIAQQQFFAATGMDPTQGRGRGMMRGFLRGRGRGRGGFLGGPPEFSMDMIGPDGLPFPGGPPPPMMGMEEEEEPRSSSSRKKRRKHRRRRSSSSSSSSSRSGSRRGSGREENEDVSSEEEGNKAPTPTKDEQEESGDASSKWKSLGESGEGGGGGEAEEGAAEKPDDAGNEAKPETAPEPAPKPPHQKKRRLDVEFVERSALKRRSAERSPSPTPAAPKRLWGPRKRFNAPASQPNLIAPRTIKINLDTWSAGSSGPVRRSDNDDAPLVLEDEIWSVNQKLFALGSAVGLLKDSSLAAAICDGLDSLLEAVRLPRVRGVSPAPEGPRQPSPTPVSQPYTFPPPSMAQPPPTLPPHPHSFPPPQAYAPPPVQAPPPAFAPPFSTYGHFPLQQPPPLHYS